MAPPFGGPPAGEVEAGSRAETAENGDPAATTAACAADDD